MQVSELETQYCFRASH